LQENSKHIISEDHNDFSLDRGCVDGLFTVQQVIKKRIARGEKTHMTFIDLKKAYDLVPKNRI
jgi:hypothetical protein